jgi:Raf kinase inhibitor-like YbhB/YbcL family protein
MFILACTTVLNCSCDRTSAAEETVDPADEETLALKLTSPAFLEGEPIPIKHTGEGLDVSPPLQWVQPPPTTASFALICDDPDAPMGTWDHWIIFNISADSTKLAEAVPTQEQLPDGTRQGLNDFGEVGYRGPMPPPGKPHRYFFRLYALDTVLDLPKPVKREDLEKMMKGHVIAEAKLMGTYQRQ